MSGLCPEPDLSCEACVEVFLDAHPGAEVWRHTNHRCTLLGDGCPFVAETDDGDVCVGCGERRDIAAEWRRAIGGRAA